MTSETEAGIADLRKLIGEVRKTFRLLAGISDEMLEERELTASLRAIVEYIFDNGPSTVPQIAAAKAMKRQSIQALVDRLTSLDLVETVPNPEHKRSVLVALTERGASTFQEIVVEEKGLLRAISEDWPEGNLQQACDTLGEFQSRLTGLRRTSDVTDLEN